MSNEKKSLRALLSSCLGAASSCAALFGIAHYSRARWLDPGVLYAGWTHGNVPGSWMIALGAALLLGLIYAAWFDEVLAGPAALRGLFFGALAWIWTSFTLSVAQGYGLGGVRAPRPLLYAGATLVAQMVLGLVVGVAYGTGRRREQAYTWGLGYGVPDRRSLA